MSKSKDFEAIPCEIKHANNDNKVFHVIEKKTGSDKLVSYGKLFPLKGTKNFLNGFEKEYGIEITNKVTFFREVREGIKQDKYR